MKKLSIIALAIILAMGCKKKNDSTTPEYSNVATINVVVSSNDSLKVTVNYTGNNVKSSYYDDLVKIYYNGNYVNGNTITPQDPNTSFSFTNVTLFTGSSYRVDLVREKTSTTSSGNQVTVATISGT